MTRRNVVAVFYRVLLGQTAMCSTIPLPGCAGNEPMRLQTATVTMGEAGALRCNVAEVWERQDRPHINAVILSKCDSPGPLHFEVLQPVESRVSGDVNVDLKSDRRSPVRTPSFPLPHNRPVDVVIAIRALCGGESVSALATCRFQ